MIESHSVLAIKGIQFNFMTLKKAYKVVNIIFVDLIMNILVTDLA